MFIVHCRMDAAMQLLLAALTGILLPPVASAQAADPFAEVKKAAEAGDAPAQFRLGQAYQDGAIGTPQNDTEACRWFQRAATAGFAPAENMLAICYQTGMGGHPRDPVQAAVWFRKAAEQGDRSAEVNLARAYRHGHGVTPDYVQ